MSGSKKHFYFIVLFLVFFLRVRFDCIVFFLVRCMIGLPFPVLWILDLLEPRILAVVSGAVEKSRGFGPISLEL